MRTAKFAALIAMAALTLSAAQDKKDKKAGRATPAPAAASQEAADPGATLDITQDFVIGAEDVLSIQVYGEPQFEVKNETVRPDGIIVMPLVGEVRAMGKAPRDLEKEIATILAEKYLKTTPRVMVVMNQINSRYYQINGAVNKPGKYPLLVPTRLMEALVNAGGFHEFANTKHIKLLRDGKVLVDFNFNDAVKGKHPERNVYLKHGDLIVVNE